MVEAARKAFVARKRRSKFLPEGMFSEYGWDMLLALYLFDHGGPTFTVTKLIEFAGVPNTTGLRWIDYLEREMLIARTPNHLDGRVWFVALTDKSRELLDRFFSDWLTSDT